MNIKLIPRGKSLFCTNAGWVTIGKRNYLIDPGPSRLLAEKTDGRFILDRMARAGINPEAKIDGIFVTHLHPDHYTACYDLILEKKIKPGQIHAHIIEKSTEMQGKVTWRLGLDGPRIMFEGKFNSHVNELETWFDSIKENVSWFDNGRSFQKKYGFDFLLTPGHSPGHVCFRCEDYLFGGDLIEKKESITELMLPTIPSSVKHLFKPPENIIKESLSKIRRELASNWRGVKVIVPGHAKNFDFVTTKEGIRKKAIAESLRLCKVLSIISKDLQKKFGPNIVGISLIGSMSFFAPRINKGTLENESDVDYIIYVGQYIPPYEKEKLRKYVDKSLESAGFAPCHGVGIFCNGINISEVRELKTMAAICKARPDRLSVIDKHYMTDLFSLPFFGDKEVFESLRKKISHTLHNVVNSKEIIDDIKKRRNAQLEKAKQYWKERGILEDEWIELAEHLYKNFKKKI